MRFSTFATIIGLAAGIATAAPANTPPPNSPPGPKDPVNPPPAKDSTPPPPPPPPPAGGNPPPPGFEVGGIRPPTGNGWPNPNPQQIMAIEDAAGGTLSNAPPPPNPGPDGITNLQLIAFNEHFEVAFFSNLVSNITNNVAGYQLEGVFRDYVLDALKAIVAQEELHQKNANAALQKFGAEPIQPCTYQFPVADFASAIALAATFTDVVMGTLSDVQQIFAKNNADGLVRGVAATLGNEGEQNGFFRLLQGKRPSSSPFLTTNARDFAFSALQSFVFPGSCPNAATIKLAKFDPLTIASKPEPNNSAVSYSVDTQGKFQVTKDNTMTYVSGVNVPVTVPIRNIVSKANTVTFDADFPFGNGFSDGLTIAALTKPGKFANVDDVAGATLAGPGLIELN